MNLHLIIYEWSDCPKQTNGRLIEPFIFISVIGRSYVNFSISLVYLGAIKFCFHFVTKLNGHQSIFINLCNISFANWNILILIWVLIDNIWIVIWSIYNILIWSTCLFQSWCRYEYFVILKCKFLWLHLFENTIRINCEQLWVYLLVNRLPFKLNFFNLIFDDWTILLIYIDKNFTYINCSFLFWALVSIYNILIRLFYIFYAFTVLFWRSWI